MIKIIDKSVLLEFITKQNTRRIRQVSFDFYKNSPNDDYIALGIYQGNILIGVTAGAYISEFGITLVDEQFRNQGHGTSLMKAKIKHFVDKNIVYTTMVAEDNICSRKLCAACGMVELSRSIATRRHGEEYTVITFKVNE